jgi:two-component system sensor histidine kinase DegS
MRCARAGSRCRRTEVPGLRDPGPAVATAVVSPPAAFTAAELARQLTEEARRVRGELEEIDLLIQQARTEAARHESRRQAAEHKLAGGAGSGGKDLVELSNQLVSVARKAALMEAQTDLLEGKRKSTIRLLEILDSHAASVARLGRAGENGSASTRVDDDAEEAADGRLGGRQRTLEALGDFAEGDAVPPAVARIVLSAQEDLRREIARAMHDGPAQSLTNIVLQAQIVERLLQKDPAKASPEVTALVAMVQRTLDATKTFIFDVRPMVLDDLGLVPTLRRSSRDRGARAGIKAEFESVGVDRRLSAELESGLFRMLDDALAAHVASKPERLSLRMDWGEHLVIELVAGKTMASIDGPELPPEGSELPPALAAMVEDRRAAHAAALEAARLDSLSRLPDRVWREIAERSSLLGINAELVDEGARLRLSVPLPSA